MARIGFSDGSGMVYLKGVFSAPFDRFRSFVPTPVPVGASVVAIGSGRTALWEYRVDYRVSLSLPYISAKTYDGERGIARAQRLIQFLDRGGACMIDVQDTAGSAAINAWLTPGTLASLELEDASAMLYTLSASFTNTTTPFVADYGGLAP